MLCLINRLKSYFKGRSNLSISICFIFIVIPNTTPLYYFNTLLYLFAINVLAYMHTIKQLCSIKLIFLSSYLFVLGSIILYILKLSLSSKIHLLCPRYEGQLMSDVVLTHDFIITCVYEPTGSDGHKRKDADAALRTIFVPFEAKGVLYAWGPVQPANGPPTRTTSG